MPSVRTDSQPISVPITVATSTATGTATYHGQFRLIASLALRAEDRDQVAGDAGDGHLRERDHPAVAAEERERQRDDAERERLPADLEREERAWRTSGKASSSASTAMCRARTCRQRKRSQRGALRVDVRGHVRSTLQRAA